MNSEFANGNVAHDGLVDLAFQQQQRNQHAHLNQRQHQNLPASAFVYTTSAQGRPSTTSLIPNNGTWPISANMTAMSSPQAQASSVSDENQASSPLSHMSSPHSHHSSLQHSPFSQSSNPLTNLALQHQQAIMAHQQLQQHQQALSQAQHQQQIPAHDMSHFIQDPAMMGYNAFPGNFHQPNPLDYLPATTQASLQASLLEPTFGSMPPMVEGAQAMQWPQSELENWHDLQSSLQLDGLPRIGASVGSQSPTGTYLEVLSMSSSTGDNGWALVDWSQPNFDQFQQTQNAAIFNPSQTLHLRTNSDSSDGANSLEIGSFEEVQPFPISPFSPESDGQHDAHANHRNCYSAEAHNHAHETTSPTTASAPVPIKLEPIQVEPVVARHSPGSGASSSPPSASARRNSGPRKSAVGKTTTKTISRRSSNGKKDGSVEKKVGRRKGPLLPEQRKQASEIRKLRACLRCKFLKKTCDKGEPCAGCQPSHARLWQVPCTRIDIKDIAYFMKDWKADFEMHLDRSVSIFNVKAFGKHESLMWITHGYGFALPVMVRQVYVADESCMSVEWVESYQTDTADFETRTEKLDVGQEGVNLAALSEYLDKHIEGPFEHFIDDHFEGTPFITEILKTAHRLYMKEKTPVICKALKLVLAYNLTVHITMVEQQGSEANLDGVVDDEDSKFHGRTVAPVLINFQIKCALADMWRELQKDILEELSSLYSGVYSGGEKMKNWPTIFMLASILLAVWEEVQFDSHYRMLDQVAINKFCSDMETTPVGVIVGLFHAISQKVPAFSEWDTRKHGHLLHNNASVCDAMTEVREHVIKHGTFIVPVNLFTLTNDCTEEYLRSRKETNFDRYDFDSLSNKFLSKLVIKAN